MLVLGHTPCRSGSPHGVFGCFQTLDAVAALAAGCAETAPTGFLTVPVIRAAIRLGQNGDRDGER